MQVDDVKVKDLCHLKGKYRETAHQSFKPTVEKCQFSFVFILFRTHSISDSHLLLKTLINNCLGYWICKPYQTTIQNYIPVKYGCLINTHEQKSVGFENEPCDEKTYHCFLTGKYRGAAHQSSYLKVEKHQSSFIPVLSIIFT